MKLRRLSKGEVTAEPFRVWNSFVDLLAVEQYEDLSASQRPAHLVFWYESEVQDGGHLQYFENRGTKHLTETIEALGLLGALCQQQILREASDLYLNRYRIRIKSVEKFCETALEEEFGSFDSRFYACSPKLTKCLENHLSRNQSYFVEVV